MSAQLRLGGRPAGPARAKLLQALKDGASGSYDALAAATGLSTSQAQRTLYHLQHEGVAASRRSRAGRQRAHYSLASNDSPFDALALMREVWR